jgi:integrase
MGSIPIPSSYDPSPYKNDLAPFLWDLKKRGYRESTIIENYAKILKNLTKNCILDNSDSVLTYLATKEISEGSKELIVDCYANYCLWKKISFIKPRYRRIDTLPIIPLEKDIKALNSALPRKVSILTRTIFEAGARCGEVWALKWVDVDFQNSALLINKPEKNSRARRLKVSAQLIGLLSTLPRRCDLCFANIPRHDLILWKPISYEKRRK